MLNENIKSHRKAKGLSQEELAAKLHVARQTLSKWEMGQSVPDAEMLIRIAKALDTSVSELLGESFTSERNNDSPKDIGEKLEALNGQYARLQEQKRKIWRILSIALAILGLVYLMDRLWFAGTIFRAMTTSPSGASSGPTIVNGSVYKMVLPMCIRMLVPPIVICAIAAIGIYKTKKNA